MRVVAVLLLLLVSATPASAATGTYLRVGHLSPENARVDITITASANPGSPVRIPNVEYGYLQDYHRIDPGSYAVTIRPAGADPSSAPTSSATLQAADGKAYTVVDLDKSGKVLEDDLSLPPAGLARVRVVDAAPKATELDLVRDGTALVRGATYGSATAYSTVAANTKSMQVVPRGTDPAGVDGTIEPGGIYTVIVVERDGKLSTELRRDAKSADVPPSGSQETGFGGMAPGGPGLDWPMVWVLLACVVTAFVLLRKPRST